MRWCSTHSHASLFSAGLLLRSNGLSGSLPARPRPLFLCTLESIKGLSAGFDDLLQIGTREERGRARGFQKRFGAEQQQSTHSLGIPLRYIIGFPSPNPLVYSDHP